MRSLSSFLLHWNEVQTFFFLHEKLSVYAVVMLEGCLANGGGCRAAQVSDVCGLCGFKL